MSCTCGGSYDDGCGLPIKNTDPLCPVHNSQSLDRGVDYEKIEAIVRRVVREENGLIEKAKARALR